jgi:hypothetical protein
MPDGIGLTTKGKEFFFTEDTGLVATEAQKH